MSICVDHQLRVRVLIPLFSNEKKAHTFVQQKSSWIRKKIIEFQKRRAAHPSHRYRDGEHFLFLGKEHKLCYVPSEKKRVKIELTDCLEASVAVSMPHDKIELMVKRALFAWYRREAKKIVNERLPIWTGRLDLSPHKVNVRTQKRIWGSCYYRTRAININWKIVMAPVDVIDYIILHELCHLHAPNHSSRFWDKVRSHFPRFKECEAWLKENEARMNL